MVTEKKLNETATDNRTSCNLSCASSVSKFDTNSTETVTFMSKVSSILKPMFLEIESEDVYLANCNKLKEKRNEIISRAERELAALD